VPTPAATGSSAEARVALPITFDTLNPAKLEKDILEMRGLACSWQITSGTDQNPFNLACQLPINSMTRLILNGMERRIDVGLLLCETVPDSGIRYQPALLR